MRKLFFFLLISLANVVVYGQEGLTRVPVFEMGESGSQYYRIPALVKAADGSLVVLADKRGNDLGDLPNIISIVAKRSTDGGKTWGEMVTVAQGNSAAGTTYGDAAVVLNEKNGELVAVFVGNENYGSHCVGLWASNSSYPLRLYKSISKDNGLTWSAPEDISNYVYGGIYGQTYSWIGLFAGSGNGLQLKKGDKAGRLMFVVAARNDSSWGGAMSNYAIYSDDNGATWNVSKNPACTNGDEAKVTEAENGDVIMSIKNRNKGFRLFARSTDGGETWSTATQNTDVMDPACNGDLIKYEHDGKYYLLHSLPGSTSVRENVTVYLSSDGGANWDIRRQIYTGYSAYSSLAVLDDGTIGIIIEEGKWDSGLPGSDGFNLSYINFTLDWLLNGQEPVVPVADGVLDLNGSRYMSIENSTDFAIPAGGEADFTITCKVKIPQYKSGANMRFVNNRAYEGTDNNGTTGFDLYGGNSSSQAVSVNLSYEGKPWGNSFQWQSGLSENVWTHMAWVLDGTTTYLYVDGQLKETKTGMSTNGIPSVADILVGAGYTNNNGTAAVPAYFTIGYMDDVRFYNVALSADEVVADMSATVGGETEGLVAAYDFENILGYDVEDISGNGHTGKLVGFPEEVQYTVKASALEGGSATVNGEAESLVWDGEEVQLVAVPDDGYEFAGWLVGSDVVSTENPYQVTVTEDVEYVAKFKEEGAVEYAYIAGNSSHDSRRFDSFTITDGVESLEVASIQPLFKSSMFVDKTALALETTAGATISFSAFKWVGEWMHAYAYVDYGVDGEFNQTLNVDGTTTGDLVSYNCYNTKDSYGNIASEQYANAREYNGSKGLPAFTLPASLAAGDYRMRVKIDWNNLSPNGASDIINNGGCQCDVIIRIVEAPVTSVDDVMSGIRIEASDDMIVISGYEGNAQIVNTLGQTVADVYVAGRANVALPAGVYIVRTDAQNTKIVVK